MNRIIITRTTSGDPRGVYTIVREGELRPGIHSREVVGWTRILGPSRLAPAESHYAICLEGDYEDGPISERAINLLGIANSREELPDRLHQLAKEYANDYAKGMQEVGYATEVVDRTKDAGDKNMTRLGAPCGDLASKL